jgi:mRNA interferase MazF
MVKGTAYIPSRGDLVWLQFAPQVGHEQSGRRPAVVVSPKAYNQKVGLCLCCPVTSRVKGYPFEVGLPEAIGVSGVVLCDQLKSLDWKARKADWIGTLPAREVSEIQGKILTLIQ